MHERIIEADAGSSPLSSLDQWLATPAGRRALRWEAAQLDSMVVDVFGYFAVQIGMDAIDALRSNRMPTRLVAVTGPGQAVPVRDTMPAATTPAAATPAAATPAAAAPAIASEFDAVAPPPSASSTDAGAGGESGGPQRPVGTVRIEAYEDLPFASQSLDLVVLPHVLEFAGDPHQVLREVDRVLRPEGRLIISGLNPVSLWGARRWLPRHLIQPFLPPQASLIGLPRLRDWLRLLSFDPGRVQYGCYGPPSRSDKWLDRMQFMETAGDRWWPVCGGIYCVSAIKRVQGIRMIGPTWKRAEASRRPQVATVARQRSGSPSSSVSQRSANKDSRATTAGD